MGISVFRANLRVTSKATALEFYNCVKHVILLPVDDEFFVRVEPNRCISLVSKADIKSGAAVFVPSMRDDTGEIAYRHRKYINAFLRGD